MKLGCMYDGCSEEFDSHNDRLAHSMKEHWGINPKEYPTLTGRSYSWSG